MKSKVMCLSKARLCAAKPERARAARRKGRIGGQVANAGAEALLYDGLAAGKPPTGCP
jgi:hypothetical protein